MQRGMVSDSFLCILEPYYMLWEKTLFYCQKEVVQIMKCRGANNCGKHGFIKNNYFMRDFLLL